MILLVGLGNPGQEYEKTRHNAGFMALDYFKKANNLPDFRFEKKFNAEISEGRIGKEKVMLAKPFTFMNNSGKTVGTLTRFYKIKPQNVFLAHDDADLPLGTMKIVKNRGAGGHKGVESVMRAIKTEDFVRFRIGTRTTKNPKIPHRSKKFMAGFVLGKITPSQEQLFKKAIKKCGEAIKMTLEDGLGKAMSEFN